jgi:hypothetical protein
MKLKEASPQEYVSQPPRGSYFTQLTSWDLYHRKDGGEWDEKYFYENHSEYCCEFDNFIPYTDVFINGMYWEDDMPPLFEKKDTKSKNFAIQVIADITCDVEGSVPITMEATDIYKPTFGWSKIQQKQVKPYGKDTVDVMAVTNLPTEMPKNASTEFGTLMLDHIMPLLIDGDRDNVLKRACMTSGGKLTETFSYLQDFVDKK